MKITPIILTGKQASLIPMQSHHAAALYDASRDQKIWQYLPTRPETLGMIRVQIKTDSRNARSQRAIERIGGVREGILRRHRIMPDGYLRDSVYYSILAAEWPHVKERLESILD